MKHADVMSILRVVKQNLVDQHTYTQPRIDVQITKQKEKKMRQRQTMIQSKLTTHVPTDTQNVLDWVLIVGAHNESLYGSPRIRYNNQHTKQILPIQPIIDFLDQVTHIKLFHVLLPVPCYYYLKVLTTVVQSLANRSVM